MAVLLSTSYLRKSFQLLAQVNSDNVSVDMAFDKATSIVYDWAKRDKFSKIFRRMPQEKTTFDDKRNGHEIGVIYSPESNNFVFRCVHPDSAIAGRMWITDVCISSASDNSITFATRLSVSSLQTCTEPVPVSRPSFIQRLINEVGLSDVIKLRDGYHIIKNTEDIDSFISFLEDQNRYMPVVLITPCFENDDAVWYDYMANAPKLAHRLTGFAHVFVISNAAKDANEYLNSRIGKWSAYNGAIRTYYPALSFDSMDYYQHPVLTKQTILLRSSFSDESNYSAAADIEEYTKRFTVARRFSLEERGLVFYHSAYQEYLIKSRTETSQSKDDIISSYEKQIEEITEEKETFEKLANSFSYDCDELERENEKKKKLIVQLKAQIDTLQYQLRNSAGYDNSNIIPSDGSYDGIADWVGEHFPNSLCLLPRAERSIKNAIYENITLVYQCLKLLGSDYYDYRMGKISRESFLEALKLVDSGLDERGAITDTAAGMQGEEYYVQYNGKRRKLERHLAKGSNKDRRYCLRIYFFWDDDDQVVVIGDMPHHLDTNAT